MLLQNQTLLAQYPIRSHGGLLGSERTLYSRTQRRNLLIGSGINNQRSGVPSGYLAPASWNLPNKPGQMTSSGNTSVSSGSAIGVQGLGGVANGDAIALTAATGVGTANGTASANGVSVGSTTGVGLAFGTAAATALGAGQATQTAQANGTAVATATGSASATTFANAFGIASTVSAVLSVDEVARAVMDSDVEGTFSLKEAMRLILATVAGKSSGGSGPTITFRDVNDTKDRVVATVASGNRTGITYDVT